MAKVAEDAVLDYEQLLAEYSESLLTVLRGFRPGAEFLETWVPDDDHAKSILNLAESAQLNGTERLALRLGPEALAALDIAQLEQMLRELGSVHLKREDNGVIVEVEYV